MDRNSTNNENVNALLADEAAEKCVLGTLLTDPSAINALAGDIDPDYFFFKPSRVVLAGISELQDRRVPVDNVALTQYLIDTGQLETVGGPAAVANLVIDHAKSFAVARHQLSVLRELWAKRHIAKLAKSLANPPPQTDIADLLAQADAALAKAKMFAGSPMRQAFIEFHKPSELKMLKAPSDSILVGDSHIVRSSVSVLGGAPGIGKSRAAVSLGVAGATQSPWFGLTVHRPFKTLIIQSENGEHRLSSEFENLDCDLMDDSIRVCSPPPFGLCFDRREFRHDLARNIEHFQPDVVIIDPWNAVARDEHARDYLDTFKDIREVIPAGKDSPALVIVAHTRKPKSEERATGRGLLNLLAGSYVLGSVPRSVFVMQSATDDPQENRIIFTCCKNNDGELGHRTAWIRRNGLFGEAEDFDWSKFDSHPSKSKDDVITQDDLAQVFEAGPLSKADAVRRLGIHTGAGRSSCYSALRLDGKFSDCLQQRGDLLVWKE